MRTAEEIKDMLKRGETLIEIDVNEISGSCVRDGNVITKRMKLGDTPSDKIPYLVQLVYQNLHYVS